MFLGKQNDLICLVAESRQELLDSGIEFTSIEETEDNYVFDGSNYILEEDYLPIIKEQKQNENTQKAKDYIENGYVTYKNAQFETNSQTVGDLTATMLMLQAQGEPSTDWLSKDDKVVKLTIEDFVVLGGLIASFKNLTWNGTYLNYKIQIEEAETVEEVKGINIIYDL